MTFNDNMEQTCFTFSLRTCLLAFPFLRTVALPGTTVPCHAVTRLLAAAVAARLPLQRSMTMYWR